MSRPPEPPAYASDEEYEIAKKHPRWPAWPSEEHTRIFRRGWRMGQDAVMEQTVEEEDLSVTTVEHCRNLLQGTGYGVFKEPLRRWAQRFNGHPLEAQAYFLTGYLAKTPTNVRQDLRDLIIAIGIPMPPTVDEDAPKREIDPW